MSCTSTTNGAVRVLDSWVIPEKGRYCQSVDKYKRCFILTVGTWANLSLWERLYPRLQFYVSFRDYLTLEWGHAKKPKIRKQHNIFLVIRQQFLQMTYMEIFQTLEKSRS